VLKKWKFSHTVVKYAGIFLGVFAFLTLAIYLILDIKKRYG
jgi:phage shock protein PspC (stress-responsive transcriptional regulator)